MSTLPQNQIEELASDWAVDYKPWETDLDYREYARYGFEIGYKLSQRSIYPEVKYDCDCPDGVHNPRCKNYMNNAQRLAAIITLLRETGIPIEDPYYLESWWQDNFSHSKCFETGVFKEDEDEDHQG